MKQFELKQVGEYFPCEVSKTHCVVQCLLKGHIIVCLQDFLLMVKRGAVIL